MDSILIYCDKGPYGTNSTAEAIRLAGGFLGLGPTIPCDIVFDRDAVYFLKNKQDTSGLNVDPLDEPLELLDLVDAEIYLVEEALHERGLKKEDLVEYPNLHLITMEKLAQMMTEYSTVVRM
ncbi:MAG: DsrE family protein [Candidatus Thorarchaeota archaeon]